MRAKLVKESLNEFHQTGDPLGSLGLGVMEKVKAKLKEIYDNKVQFAYYTYKIVNLNHIEIFYKPEIVRKWLEVKDPEDVSKIKYIFKYVELPKYILNERNYKYNLFDRDFNEHTLSVYETEVFFGYDPDRMYIKQDKKLLDIGEYGNELVNKIGDIIIKALNEEFEPVWGFELVEQQK